MSSRDDLGRLRDTIRTGEKRLYLFYGSEDYLIKQYRRELENTVGGDMNITRFEGDNTDIADVIAAVDTMPFFSERRLVVFSRSGLFKPEKKDEDDAPKKPKTADTRGVALLEYLKNIPETAILLFIEAEADKRNRFYKAVDKNGLAFEFTRLSEPDLMAFVAREAKRLKRNLPNAAALHLVRSVGADLNKLVTELEKLAGFTDSSITISDIDEICSKSAEARIFTLVDAIGEGKTEKALAELNNLIASGESAFFALVMIARQLRLIIQCAEMDRRGISSNEIARALDLRSFMVTNYMKQARSMKLERFIEAYRLCLETDVAMKSTPVNPNTAIEQLIIRIAS